MHPAGRSWLRDGQESLRLLPVTLASRILLESQQYDSTIFPKPRGTPERFPCPAPSLNSYSFCSPKSPCSTDLPDSSQCSGQFSSVQSLSRVWLFAIPWTTARQASLSVTSSQSLPKLMSIESVMPSSNLIRCRPLLLLPSIFPSIRVFSSDSILPIRWPKHWSFSFSIRPSNEYSGLISLRMDWLDLLAVRGTLNSLLQHHSSKASILRRSAFFMVQLSHPHMTTGKTIAQRSAVPNIQVLDEQLAECPWVLLSGPNLCLCPHVPFKYISSWAAGMTWAPVSRQDVDTTSPFPTASRTVSRIRWQQSRMSEELLYRIS